jgi:hypothetical protein
MEMYFVQGVEGKTFYPSHLSKWTSNQLRNHAAGSSLTRGWPLTFKVHSRGCNFCLSAIFGDLIAIERVTDDFIQSSGSDRLSILWGRSRWFPDNLCAEQVQSAGDALEPFSAMGFSVANLGVRNCFRTLREKPEICLRSLQDSGRAVGDGSSGPGSHKCQLLGDTWRCGTGAGPSAACAHPGAADQPQA